MRELLDEPAFLTESFKIVPNEDPSARALSTTGTNS